MNKVGLIVTVSFPQVASNDVDAKVDTGASLCCLHATDIQISGDSVSFKCNELSQNVITLPLAGDQTVKSADGGENTRPVVALDIAINGVKLNNIQFNLNDRSGMDQSILIGQNALAAGDFVVDVQESIDNSELPITQIQNDTVDNNEKLLEAIRILKDSNITISELLELLTHEQNQITVSNS